MDPRVEVFDEWELQGVFQDIRFLIYNSDHNHIVLIGDTNAHFSRKTRFTLAVEEFLLEINLRKVWDNFPVDYTFCHTQQRNGQLTSYFSTIDHFFMDHSLELVCKAADSIHIGDNLGGHQPIHMTLKLGDFPKPVIISNTVS